MMGSAAHTYITTLLVPVLVLVLGVEGSAKVLASELGPCHVVRSATECTDRALCVLQLCVLQHSN